MSDEQAPLDGSAVPPPDDEITARFHRDELVRGWRDREPRSPRLVPILRFGARTDLGRIRENNEDKFDLYEPEDATLLATRGSFFAVADGMGGHAAGQIASELALKTVLTAYYDSANEDIATSLLEAMAMANDTVHNLAIMVPERSGMGTTMTAAVLAEDTVYVGHVGDSRAYLLRDGAIEQITNDHSWVAEQVRSGVLTAEEAETSPYRNVITRSIGTQPLVEPDLYKLQAEAGDVWVLCSDGLTGHVQDDEIRQIASTQSPWEAARQLVELANARGGRDNVTVVVVSLRELRQVDTAPAEPPRDELADVPLESPADSRRGLKRLFGG